MIAATAGANQVVISDFPNTERLATIKVNVKNNIPEDLQRHVDVQAHEWGMLQDAFSMAHAGHFTRILSADCLWMAGEHFSLVQTMLHFSLLYLGSERGSRSGGDLGEGRVWTRTAMGGRPRRRYHRTEEMARRCYPSAKENSGSVAKATLMSTGPCASLAF